MYLNNNINFLTDTEDDGDVLITSNGGEESNEIVTNKWEISGI